MREKTVFFIHIFIINWSRSHELKAHKIKNQIFMQTKSAIYRLDLPILRYCLFLGLTSIAIWINGYRFGTYDQVVHIPIYKKIIHPELVPFDSFLSIHILHFSFFWFIFISMAKANPLERSVSWSM